VAHYVRTEIATRRADHAPVMISADVTKLQADSAARPSRIGIEHRDHDRHVGAADRYDHEATPSTERYDGVLISQKSITLPDNTADDEEPSASARNYVDYMARRRLSARRSFRVRQLRNAITEPVEVSAESTSERISTKLCG